MNGLAPAHPGQEGLRVALAYANVARRMELACRPITKATGFRLTTENHIGRQRRTWSLNEIGRN